MTTTGRMAYGSLPTHHPDHSRHPDHPGHHPRHDHHPWWTTGAVAALLVVVFVLMGGVGWVGDNWNRFNTNSDRSLCKLLKDAC